MESPPPPSTELINVETVAVVVATLPFSYLTQSGETMVPGWFLRVLALLPPGAQSRVAQKS